LGIRVWGLGWRTPYYEVMSRRKVGKKMGVTMTDEAQLRRPVRPIDWEKVDAITRKLAAMPILDSRTPDEILGYDEFGLPS